MNLIYGTVLSLAVTFGGLASSAQDQAIPLRQIERDARDPQLSARAAVPANEAAVGNGNGMFYSSSSSSGFVLASPAAKPPRTFSSGFLLLNGMHLGLAVLDVELTQHCIANQHCVEGNPLMPSSHAGKLGVNFALVGWGTFISYKFKKQGNKLWVLSPTVGIAAHAVGVATGIAHR